MTQVFAEDLKIERSGSPRLAIHSRGSGTQHYSIRATNKQDPAGGRKFIIRNEDQKKDVVIIDHAGNIDVPGDIRLTGADCAENFDIVQTEANEPGTVMTVNKEGALQKCSKAYDKKVAGVVSGAGDYRPGIVLDQKNETQKKRLPIALIGKVFCKVDADYETIDIGDLLTTSVTPGHAMKASDPPKAFGSVIGKALGSLNSGKGLIPILVTMQ